MLTSLATLAQHNLQCIILIRTVPHSSDQSSPPSPTSMPSSHYPLPPWFCHVFIKSSSSSLSFHQSFTFTLIFIKLQTNYTSTPLTSLLPYNVTYSSPHFSSTSSVLPIFFLFASKLLHWNMWGPPSSFSILCQLFLSLNFHCFPSLLHKFIYPFPQNWLGQLQSLGVLPRWRAGGLSRLIIL